jgi:hypothetical protein
MAIRRYLKLTMRILDDYKIAHLPDHLWRRLIELRLIAVFEYSEWQERSDDFELGDLPPAPGIAWRLRISEDELARSLNELIAHRLLIVRPNGRYHLLDFAEKQRTPRWFTIDSALREMIMIRDGRTCQYCGKPAEHIDHVIPRCQGGTDDPDNLVAACAFCNLSKGGRTPEQAGMVLGG